VRADFGEELERSEKESTALKKQAEGTRREYERLLEENAELHKKLENQPKDKKRD
jgi:hypothetical protein